MGVFRIEWIVFKKNEKISTGIWLTMDNGSSHFATDNINVVNDKIEAELIHMGPFHPNCADDAKRVMRNTVTTNPQNCPKTATALWRLYRRRRRHNAYTKYTNINAINAYDVHKWLTGYSYNRNSNL